jgi:hypothetical protein
VSYFESAKRKTVAEHIDGSEPCAFDGSLGVGSQGLATTFAFGDPIFQAPSLDKAEQWARRLVEKGQESLVFLGFVRGNDGHRVIGQLESHQRALSRVERTPDGVRVTREPAKAG